MRRLLGAFKYACFVMLCYAAVPLVLAHILLGDCCIGMIVLAALLPISFLLSFIPGKLGGGVREEVIVRSSRGSDPDPDKGLRNEALPLPEKRSFPLRAFCCLIACIGVAAGMYMLPLEAVQSAIVVKRVFMSLVMAVMLPLALRVVVLQEEDTASMVGGVAAYAVSGFIAHFFIAESADLQQWMTYFAIGFLLFCAFGMNDNSMSRGAAVKEGVRPPAFMRRRNRMMIGVMVVIGGIVLYFDKLRDWAVFAARKVMWVIGAVIAWIFNLGAPTSGVESSTLSGGGGGNMADMFGAGEASQVWIFLEKIMFVIVGAAIAVVIWLFGRRIWRIAYDLTRRLIARLKRLTAAVSEDYQDEQESLFDWGETTKELGEGVRERLSRLLKREKRYEQLDVRERMRYIVRTLYRRSEHPQGLKSLTVHEAMRVIKTGEAQPQELAQLYDQARYAQQEMDRETVDRLRKEAKV